MYSVMGKFDSSLAWSMVKTTLWFGYWVWFL